MPPLVTSTEIQRPAAEVFAYATDPARFSEWQKGVVDGRTDSPAHGRCLGAVGAKCATTRRIAGTVRREARNEMPANMAALRQRMEAG